ncbi:hypothetical protein ACO2Q3_04535 [Caulobacter sp. KR2-114]|uniref:hypothetical protein n=1 Tax=Caulobacter sp. KR2-114 TaxID=3400912 RepID=UPI003C11AD19
MPAEWAGAALAACLGAAVLFGWLGARPARPMSPPRLVPYRVLMLASFTAAVFLATYLVALLRQDPVP